MGPQSQKRPADVIGNAAHVKELTVPEYAARHDLDNG